MAKNEWRAFGIFQGGGAQGVSHIGAYLAAKEAGVNFVGVAGASAGAIVAALIAVGYQPNEIINRNSSKTAVDRDVLSRHDLDPVSVMGVDDWRRLQTILKFFSHMSGILILLSGWFVFALLFAVFAVLCPDRAGGGFWMLGGFLVLTALLLYYAIPGLLQIRKMAIDRGILDPKTVEIAVERVLQSKVAEAYRRAGVGVELPRKLTFGDIDPWAHPKCGFSQLKIAVTDISNGRLQMFGADNFPGASVAEVVAASVAIPLIFKPAKICSVKEFAERQFVDGGLVSNLPVGSFSEEKAYEERRVYPFEPVSVLAFTLEDGPDNNIKDTSGVWRWVVSLGRHLIFQKANLDFRSYVAHTLRTGIMASQAIGQSTVPDLHVFPLKSPLRTLEFDAPWERIVMAFNQGMLERSKIRAPVATWEEVQLALKGIHAFVSDLLLRNYDPKWEGRIRLLVFQPEGRTSFSVTHHFGLGDDVDDLLRLDKNCPGVPESFLRKSPIFIARDESHQSPQSCARLPMTKYEFAHMWPKWRSAVCIPIFHSATEYEKNDPSDRINPIAVLSIDSDYSLSDVLMRDEHLESLVAQCLGLSTFLHHSEGRG